MKPRLKPRFEIEEGSNGRTGACQPSTSTDSAPESSSTTSSESDNDQSSTSSSSDSEEDDDPEYEYDEAGPNRKKRKMVEDDGNGVTTPSRKILEKNRLCPFCGYSTFYPNKLRIHLETNHYEKHRFSCPVDGCDAAFQKYQELREHKRDSHPILHYCRHCSYSNKSKSWVKRHTLQNHVNGIVCTVAGCGMKMAKNRMKRHILECHRDTEQKKKPEEADGLTRILEEKCPYCDYLPDESNIDAIMRRNDMNMHIERIHLKKSEKCPLGCGKMLIMSELDEHFESDHNGNVLSINEETASTSATSGIPNTDSVVETESRSEDGLSDDDNDGDGTAGEDSGVPKKIKRHRNIENEGLFECLSCDKKFMQRDYLRKHIARVHDKRYSENRTKRKLKFTCEWHNENDKICGKSFATKGLFDDHMNVHLDLKPYKCHTCDQSFHARARFAVHLSKYHQISIRSYSFVESSLPVMIRNAEDPT